MSPSQIKRIGILTGGGDCPGLNAVIRAVAKTAMLQHGIQVFGIEDGFQGLIEDRVHPLTFADVSGILTRGGTILGTNNKCNPRKWAVGRNADGSPVFADCTRQCIETVQRHALDAIVVIGGDGTMAASTGLVDAGINIIGVPKTIDNDLHGTEITFGFLTAVATATDALDKLHSTADSHHRVMVCEVMGRNAGWIALTAGVASGSDIILIPEIPFELDVMCASIDRRVGKGPGFAIVVVGEGAMPKGGSQVIRQLDPTSPDPVRLGGIGAWVAQELAKRTTADVRSTNLGHIVRGGTPIAADRILATHFGYHAISMLMDGARNRLVVRQNNIFSDIDLMASAGKQRLVPVDHPLVSAARAIGTGFGDASSLPRASREPSAVF